ncbi:MAG TPA: DUF2501 domain-containing protein [Variovorax sp.]
MNTSVRKLATLGALLALTAGAGIAQAQNLDTLKGMVGGASGGLGSMTSGSLGNAAGVLEFCVKNNYIGGDASAVKDQLMSKIPGGKPASDTGYVSGAKGLLTGSDGKTMDLTGGGLKQEITKKACDVVLKQGKSMI